MGPFLCGIESEEMLDIQKASNDSYLTFTLAGRLDADGSGMLEAEVEKALRDGDHHLRLDLEKVDFISSAAIRVLLKTYQSAKKLGGAFGVLRASQAVRSVLMLSRLDILLSAIAPMPPPSSKNGKDSIIDGVNCTSYELSAKAEMACSLYGDPPRLSEAPYEASHSCPVSLPPDSLGLGLGAFGDGFEDCRDRFGEFLAVAGCAVHLPPGESSLPDFIVARGELVPSVQALYGVVCAGPFQSLVRFEGEEKGEKIPLSTLVRAIGAQANKSVVAWAMIAETAGLVGASMKRSPTFPFSGGFFDFPSVRDRLSFTPERENVMDLCLVVGVTAFGESPDLAPFLRPLGDGPFPLSHQHAVTLGFRAIPKGNIPLKETVRAIVDESRLTNVLHLFNDRRPAAGSGESLFLQGAVWLSGVSGVARATGPGPEQQRKEGCP